MMESDWRDYVLSSKGGWDDEKNKNHKISAIFALCSWASRSNLVHSHGRKDSPGRGWNDRDGHAA